MPSSALAALAQDNRLDVFRLLVKAGPEGLAAGEVARRLESPPNTLSFHFDRLRQAGLVTVRRESRSLIYAAQFDTMNGLIDFLTENCCAGVTDECGPNARLPNARKAGARNMNPSRDLPVAVIGGGPVGLAAAAHLVTRGVPVRLYEAGETVAAHVRDWGHVRLFSPWGFNTDTAATAILREHGWQAPPATRCRPATICTPPISQPLAETPALRAVIETGARVRNVSRDGIDKVVSRGRGDHPFALTIEDANGASRIDLARAVIDASGTWTNQNPARASGTPAIGEAASRTASPTAFPMCSGAIAPPMRAGACW